MGTPSGGALGGLVASSLFGLIFCLINPITSLLSGEAVLGTQTSFVLSGKPVFFVEEYICSRQ